jgi:hypothetical protein
MLFQQRVLDGIRDGSITLAFRRWRRPTVRAGGTLLTAVGELSIAAVSPVTLGEISEDHARRAGYESRAALLATLREGAEGTLYRIELGALRPDPRVALRASDALTEEERRGIVNRLTRLDTHAPAPWTLRTLEIIASHPAVRAGDLCRLLDQEKEPFKINVRKLKNLGLTESLEVGYRLSPRGATLLRALRQSKQPPVV